MYFFWKTINFFVENGLINVAKIRENKEKKRKNWNFFFENICKNTLRCILNLSIFFLERIIFSVKNGLNKANNREK